MEKNTPAITIAEKGISAELFDAYLGDFVKTHLTTKEVKQVGTVDGVEYKLTIRLTRWAGRTSIWIPR